MGRLTRCIALPCVLATIWTIVYAAVDRTIEERAVGSEVVQAVVDQIRENCIYSQDRLFLRRLAYVESRDGLDPATFKQGFYGGIWQVKRAAFESTKNCTGVLVYMCERIRDTLGITWQNVRWEDLLKPLYSGLAAALYVRRRAGISSPGLIESQSTYWNAYYHEGQTPATYISRVKEMKDDDCSHNYMDLVFIIDGSGSIGYINFIRMLDFVKNVTESFVLSPKDVQIALVSFSNFAQTEFMLTSYYNHSSMKTAIDNTLYEAGGTETADGIRLARRVFDPFYGGRSDATKVGIIITDGQSNNFFDTVQQASLAKDEGIVLFALGIGNINHNELEHVASKPNCTHVNVLSGFSEIDSMLYEIEKAACRAPQVINFNTLSSNDTDNSSKDNQTVVISKLINETFSVSVQNPKQNNTDPPTTTVMNVNVTCGIVHVYTSYNTPHPGPAYYDIKETATDGRPLVLYLNTSVDGRPLYISYVGRDLPKDIAGLKNCNSSGYTVSFVDKQETHVEIVCKENGHERPCSPVDFTLNGKYLSWLCPSTGGQTNANEIPNPCTATAIKNNQLYHPYPYDDSKFIKCDYQGKMYITMCPNGERYHPGSHSCGSTAQTLAGGDKVPLDPTLANPCTAQALINHQYFFAYTRDVKKFIHCDVWGHAWVMNCPTNLVWNQPGQTCVEDTHTSGNPCTQAQMDNGITMFPHPDKHKYIHCDNGLNPWVQHCSAALVFDFASQNCVSPSNPFGK